MAQIEIKMTHKFPFPNHKTFSISPKFAIHLQPSTSYAELSDAKKNLIQTIWDKEQERCDGKLHEGVILSAVSFDHKSLIGQFVPYKYFLAQFCDPSLKPDLQIRPVSLNGITYLENQLILAKRSPWVAQCPGYYELAPSGGIRPPSKNLTEVDMKVQLLDELKEETGIENSSIKNVKYFALVHDLKGDGIELCAEIRLKSSGLILSSSSEYTQVMTVPCSEIPVFTKEHEREFVPLSLLLLKLKNLI